MITPSVTLPSRIAAERLGLGRAEANMAAAAIQLAGECSDSAHERAYRELARSVLQQGQPEDDVAAQAYQQRILDHELLSDLDASKF